ncbi:MAG: HEPN domain-containing protein [Methanobrevibacter sp.]|jgi:uncharacterized protein (UPF0332 family)|nr:HEPN domain-containing protein [Candidatus Methanovirga basalitermitum]
MDEVHLIFQRALKTLKVAESNFNNEFYPDSINRSYYAVFYAAKALLLKKGISSKTHTGTIHQFCLEYAVNDTFDKEISKFFARIEEDREKADYDLTFEFSRLKAKKI